MSDVLNDVAISDEDRFPVNSNTEKNERLKPDVPISAPKASSVNKNNTTDTKTRLSPVSKGKLKKKSKAEKAVKSVVNVDSGSIKSFVFGEVLIPAIKDTLYHLVSDGLSMILFDKTGGSTGGRRYGSSSGTRVSYSSYYRDSATGMSRESRADRYSRREDVGDDIVFPSRAEAEDVIDELGNVMDQYGQATLADLYDLAGVTAPYTYNRYGWKSTRGFDVRHTRDGWMIVTPRAIPI